MRNESSSERRTSHSRGRKRKSARPLRKRSAGDGATARFANGRPKGPMLSRVPMLHAPIACLVSPLCWQGRLAVVAARWFMGLLSRVHEADRRRHARRSRRTSPHPIAAGSSPLPVGRNAPKRVPRDGPTCDQTVWPTSGRSNGWTRPTRPGVHFGAFCSLGERSWQMTV